MTPAPKTGPPSNPPLGSQHFFHVAQARQNSRTRIISRLKRFHFIGRHSMAVSKLPSACGTWRCAIRTVEDRGPTVFWPEKARWMMSLRDRASCCRRPSYSSSSSSRFDERLMVGEDDAESERETRDVPGRPGPWSGSFLISTNMGRLLLCACWSVPGRPCCAFMDPTASRYF
jgi:hypothetical protein